MRKMRKKIWIFIKYKIFRIKEGGIVPKWLIWIRYILFPIHTIRCWPEADPRYEPWNDTFTIFGQRYSGGLFRDWAEDGMPEGSNFRFLNRDPIILEKLTYFTFIDLKDGSGGFMIPDGNDNKELIEEILKNPKYVLREIGKR